MSGALLAFLTVGISDRLWNTPQSARVVLWALLVGSVVGYALWKTGRWGIRLRSWNAFGRFIRGWDRRTGDRVLAALELSSSGGQAIESPQLRQAAMTQLAEQLGQADLRGAFDHHRLRRIRSTAVTLILLVGALLLLAPEAGINTAKRCFSPWASVPRFTFVQLDAGAPSQIVAHGEPLEWVLDLKPNSPWSRPLAHARFHNPPNRFEATLDQGRYTFQLPGLTDPTTLHFRVGDAQGAVHFLPKHRPGLESLTATIRLPDYLQRPPVEEAITDGHLIAVSGSQFRLQGLVSRPLTGAEMREERIETLKTQGPQFEIPAMPIPETPRLVEIHWTDHFGLSPKTPLRLRIASSEDQAPRVEMLSDAPSPLSLLGHEAINLAVRAEDDFGLRSIGYLYGTPKDAPSALWTDARARSLAEGTPSSLTLDADTSFSPQQHGLGPGTWQIWAFAQDYRPDTLPAFSSPTALQILTDEQHAALVQAQFRQVQERLEDLARKEADLMQGNRELAASAKPPSPEAIARQAQAEKKNTERLEQLVQDSQELLEEAMKNASLDSESLRPWSEMLGAMRSVARQGMPQAAESLSQAQGAAQAGNTTAAQEGLNKAVAQQEDNLKQLAAAMGKGAETEENLEAATFVNRLRQAAAAEEEVATSMKVNVFQAAGLTPDQLDSTALSGLHDLASTHERSAEEVNYLMSDLEHYHRRTEKPIYGKIHQEMSAAEVPTALTGVTRRVRGNQHGRAIGQALHWAAQFHAWADALAEEKAAQQAPANEEGTGESPSQANAEMMIALMRLVQREMILRDQTRAAEELASDSLRHRAASAKLTEDQRAIGFTLAGLMPRVLGPDLQARMRTAAEAIDDAAKLLANQQTGGETIAAETEVIERLALAAQSASQVGGKSKAAEALAEMLAMMELGNNPGGNPTGGASSLSSTESEGAADREAREKRRVEQTRAHVAGDFPEEFRDVLGHFFEQREQLRDQEVSP